VADKPGDMNFGTAQTAPADVPAYADGAGPWDSPAATAGASSQSGEPYASPGETTPELGASKPYGE